MFCSLFPDFCDFQDLMTKKPIGEGRERDGLYYMERVPRPSPILANTVTAELWHQRLVHPSTNRLNLFLSKNFVVTNDDPKDLFCSTCPLAKHTRLPFTSRSERCMQPFDLVHTDLWGPARSSSFSGATYFVIFVDDYTRCTWLYLLKHKSDVVDVFHTFYAMVCTQFNRPIKILRSDNGTEFTSGAMKSFYREKGILHQNA